MRERPLVEQSVEDAIEQGNIRNIVRYLFEVLLDIRDKT